MLGTLLSAGCDSLISKPSLYGTVEVTATLRTGEAVPGAAVKLYTGQRAMGYATTDANGRYRFLSVPAGAYGVFAAAPPGYARLEDAVGGIPTGYQDGYTVLGGDTSRAHFTFLKIGPGAITVSVTEPDGTPIPATQLTLYTPTAVVGEGGSTDAKGRFTFVGLPFGGYGVIARRANRYLDSGEVALVSRDKLVVEEGSQTTVAFVFSPCFGALTARIRDDAGAALPAAVVTLYDATGVLEEVPSGPDGNRTFANRGCGAYGIRVKPPVGWFAPEGRGSSFNDGLYVHRDATLASTLTVHRIPRASLRVRVEDETGAAVPGARVVLYTFQGIVRDVVTAANGEVIMSDILTDQSYGVQIQAPVGYRLEVGRGLSFNDGIVLVGGEVRTQLLKVFRR